MSASSHLPHILALDHGTSGCKVALVSIHGHIAATAAAPTPIRYLPGGGAEQDPDDWWQAFLTAARSVLARTSVPRASIEAIAVSSTFSSTVAVDRDGRALMPSLTWMDSRGAPYVQRVMGGFPSLEGYALGKLVHWVRVSGGAPELSGKDDIAHVLFVKHERPGVYAQTRYFLGSKDYLNLRLTGNAAASYDSIMLFWVTDTRHVDRVRYDDGLIRLAGIERDKLPDLAPAPTVLGTLRPSVAEELGLPPTVKVVVASPDHQSALIGSGAVRDYEAHGYIGTSSWIECLVPFKKTDVLHSIASVPSTIPGRYQVIDEQDIAGGALSFLVENVLYHGGRKAPAEPYRALDEIAAAVPPGSHGVLVAPWLNGERTPVDSTTLRGGIYNLSLTSTADDIVRAAYEGVAYNTRWSLAHVERFVGRRFPSLTFVGGGARSDVWCRIFADVLDRPVLQAEDAIWANARGAAAIAAVALGHLKFEDLPGLARRRAVYEPDPARRALYDELYGAFLDVYRRNKGLYARLNRVRPAVRA